MAGSRTSGSSRKEVVLKGIPGKSLPIYTYSKIAVPPALIGMAYNDMEIKTAGRFQPAVLHPTH